METLKYLHDELHLLQHIDVLKNTLAMITSTLQYKRQQHRKENGTLLKDKSLKVTTHKIKSVKLQHLNPLL